MEFKCSLCDYKSVRKAHIVQHINRKIKCNDSEDEPKIISIKINVECIHCNNKYASVPNLNRHLKTCKVKK